ncbi:MAG: glycosyltransferase [Granulicella sp.]
MTRPFRIAIYLHTLFNGGIERVMFNLIQGFLDQGIAVDLVLNRLDYSPFEKIIPEETRVVKLEAFKIAQRVPKLAEYLRRERPDALLSAAHFSNEIACLARRFARTNTRLILSEHTSLSSHMSEGRKLSPRMLLPWTTRRLYPMADAVVAVSNGVADDLCRVSKLPRNLVQTIYNPIDFVHLAATAKEPLDDPWFAPGAPPVILAIGRLETQKNFPNLLHAFAEVRKQREARLVILGEGSERARLTSLITELGLQQDVSLPGFVMNPAAYMARSSVFAMSSTWEGLPVALLEALALRIPIVSTDCPSGPAEILRNGMYGELVPMHDSKALAQGILNILSGTIKTVEPEWLEQFDAAIITQKYLDLMINERL